MPDDECRSCFWAARLGRRCTTHDPEMTMDHLDSPPDPTSAEQAAAVAKQAGVLPPGGLAILGPEVASQVRHQILPDGEAMIVVRIEHATGSTVVGLTLGHAMELSNMLRREHRAAELASRGNGKLVVPEVRLPRDLRG